MDKLGLIWDWLSDDSNRAIISWIGGGLVVIAGGFWTIIKFFSKRGTDSKQAISGIIAGGAISAGGNITIINKDFPLEKFENLLKERNQEILDKIAHVTPEKRGLLENELEAIKSSHDNLLKAYEEQKARLAEAYQAIDEFKQNVPSDQLEKAKKNLAHGQTEAAEALFRQALERGTGQAAEAAYQLGVLAEGRIDYGKAERYYRQAVQFQPDNPRYLNTLGSLQGILGRYQEAQPHLERALDIREKSLAKEPLDAATSLNNLALLYKTQGMYSDAEPLYRRALAIREKSLGPENPEVANSINNLALLYKAQGKFSQAEPLLQRALVVVEKVEGNEHPHAAICLNNLAELYRSQGKYSEAEPLQRRALAIREKILGPEHPHVANSLNNLALLYEVQGSYGEAEPLYRRALAIWKSLRGRSTRTWPPACRIMLFF